MQKDNSLNQQPKQQSESDYKKLQYLMMLQKHPDFGLDIPSLEGLIKTHEKLLSDKNILANLPDGGRKIYDRLQILRTIIELKKHSMPRPAPQVKQPLLSTTSSAPQTSTLPTTSTVPIPSSASNVNVNKSMKPPTKGDALDDLTLEISKLAISGGSQKSKVSPKLLETLLDSLNKEGTSQTQDQPKDLQVQLLPYQLEGLKWLSSNEIGEKSPKGGMLCDDQGLGKTVQMLSLILSNRSTDPEIKTTLIISPLSTLSQWSSEISTKTMGLKQTTYHGSQKSALKDLKNFDIVLTTYGTLSSEFKVTETKEGEVKYTLGTLLKNNWYRVVLDEAHNIKNRKTKMSNAVFQLQSKYRWCLTGTPIQNSLEDLFSLFYFLKVPEVSDYAWFKSNIIKMAHSQNQQQMTKGYLRLQSILKSILLRRTKQTKVNGKNIIELPSVTVNTKSVAFSSKERIFYDFLFINAKTTYKQFMNKEGTMFSILEVLLRLRQMCDHSYLVLMAKQKKDLKHLSIRDLNAELDKITTDNNNVPLTTDKSVPSSKEEITDLVIKKEESTNTAVKKEETITTSGNISTQNASLVASSLEINNSICMCCESELDNIYSSNGCEHSLCSGCIESQEEFDGSNEKNKIQCPVCEKKIIVELKNAISKPDLIDQTEIQLSTKLEALVHSLENENKDDKKIVFSQFTSFLDIVEIALNMRKIKFVRLDGSLSHRARSQAIQSFKTDANVRVFLISLKAGGVGLNLTEANHVYLCDPWWNPAIEQQAIDRVHRLGQSKPVTVTRFIVATSIEEKILQLHEKKKQLAQGALGENRQQLSKLNMKDLELLFSN